MYICIVISQRNSKNYCIILHVKISKSAYIFTGPKNNFLPQLPMADDLRKFTGHDFFLPAMKRHPNMTPEKIHNFQAQKCKNQMKK